jgi:peroxiredoxin Q/BCP
MPLAAGDRAPAIHLPDQDGKKRRLSEFKGKWVLLFFYPKDNTPGCTKEACGFRDEYAKLRRKGAEVVGISVDPVKSHRKFVDKFELPFTLLADEDKEIVQKYGVWGKKKFMGREFMGTHRMSFLIDPKGKIAKVYAKVKPPEHAAQVLADLKELGA